MKNFYYNFNFIRIFNQYWTHKFSVNFSLSSGEGEIYITKGPQFQPLDSIPENCFPFILRDQEFQSPGYPNNYPPLVDCALVIKGTKNSNYGIKNKK